MITFTPETKGDDLLRKWVGQHFSEKQQVTVGYRSFADVRVKLNDRINKNYELRDKRLVRVDHASGQHVGDKPTIHISAEAPNVPKVQSLAPAAADPASDAGTAIVQPEP